MSGSPDSLQLPLERAQVARLLPHAPPALMVDRVTAFDGEMLEAEVYVDPAWTLFAGHFPERPLLPGVILIEMIAQTGALLGGLANLVEKGSFLAFTGIEKAKFRRPVLPGETVQLYAKIEGGRSGFHKFSGRASVDGRLAAQTLFTAAKMDFDT